MKVNFFNDILLTEAAKGPTKKQIIDLLKTKYGLEKEKGRRSGISKNVFYIPTKKLVAQRKFSGLNNIMGTLKNDFEHLGFELTNKNTIHGDITYLELETPDGKKRIDFGAIEEDNIVPSYWVKNKEGEWTKNWNHRYM